MIQTPTKYLSFEEYLTYFDGTDNRYELVNGHLVLMTPPTGEHEDIVHFLYDTLRDEINRLQLDLVVRISNTGVRTAEDKSRLPDLVVITQEQRRSLRNRPGVLQTPPLLAVEVTSESTLNSDYRFKRSEYATREIFEYWIVDPINKKMTVLLLVEGFYEAVEFTGTDEIISQTFPELSLNVEQILQV